MRWVEIPGWEGAYEISRDGQVRSLERVVVRRNGNRYRCRATILRPYRHRSGHLSVLLSRPGCKRRVYIAALLREAFH
ncbi:MAG: hypothetical protein JWR32_3006 [Mycobacterium sp.]|jgi:hypothetical protein|nr:hypothetical protein [Mycobacterium sp.]